jgi:hypothetical protein
LLFFVIFAKDGIQGLHDRSVYSWLRQGIFCFFKALKFEFVEGSKKGL